MEFGNRGQSPRFPNSINADYEVYNWFKLLFFSLPGRSLALFNHQATWLAIKLADSTLNGPLLAI